MKNISKIYVLTPVVLYDLQWPGLCHHISSYGNKEEYDLDQSDVSSFVEQVVKNNSKDNCGR